MTVQVDDPVDPRRFRPSDVMAFVSLNGRFAPRSMKTVRTALRRSAAS